MDYILRFWENKKAHTFLLESYNNCNTHPIIKEKVELIQEILSVREGERSAYLPNFSSFSLIFQLHLPHPFEAYRFENSNTIGEIFAFTSLALTTCVLTYSNTYGCKLACGLNISFGDQSIHIPNSMCNWEVLNNFSQIIYTCTSHWLFKYISSWPSCSGLNLLFHFLKSPFIIDSLFAGWSCCRKRWLVIRLTWIVRECTCPSYYTHQLKE